MRPSTGRHYDRSLDVLKPYRECLDRDTMRIATPPTQCMFHHFFYLASIKLVQYIPGATGGMIAVTASKLGSQVIPYYRPHACVDLPSADVTEAATNLGSRDKSKSSIVYRKSRYARPVYANRSLSKSYRLL